MPDKKQEEKFFIGAIPQDTVRTTDKSFEALGLSEVLIKTLTRHGFEHPTPIQSEAIPVALSGRDVIGLAQTGSGKTAAFGLPLIERLTPGGGVQGLVVSPTREIAMQTTAFMETFAADLGFTVVCLIGGVKLGPQISTLRKRPEIVVATPGRLLDHVERGNLRLDTISKLVIDEADHMLDLGFLPQIRRILVSLPKERHSMMFSATMPEPIERLTARFLREPVRIDILPEGRAAEGIEHRLYLVAEPNRKPALLALAEEEHGSMLVFLRRKIDAEWAYRQLEVAGHSVDRMHSDRSQSQRLSALRGLREGDCRILLATDVAARGIDIPIIQHIVNMAPPETVEDYIHRAGRTARGSAKGTVSTIAIWKDRAMIAGIERALGRSLPRCVAPGVEPYIEPRKKIGGRERVRRRLL